MGRKPPLPGICEAWCSAVPFCESAAARPSVSAMLMGHQPMVGFGGPHIANTCSVAAVSPRRRVPLVRPGRRPPGEDRPGDEAVQRHGRVAQRRQAVSAEHPPRAGASLTRLQTDYIDLYQFHHVDGLLRGTRSGRRSTSPSPQARSFTSAAATSRAGTSPRPRKPLGVAALAGRCARCRPHGQVRTLPIAAGVDGQPAHLCGLAD